MNGGLGRLVGSIVGQLDDFGVDSKTELLDRIGNSTLDFVAAALATEAGGSTPGAGTEHRLLGAATAAGRASIGSSLPGGRLHGSWLTRTQVGPAWGSMATAMSSPSCGLRSIAGGTPGRIPNNLIGLGRSKGRRLWSRFPISSGTLWILHW